MSLAHRSSATQEVRSLSRGRASRRNRRSVVLDRPPPALLADNFRSLEGLDPELLADRLRRELAELACRPGVGQIRLDGEEVAEADCLPRRAHKGIGLHREAVGGGDLRPSQITERACDQVERREFCRTCRDRGWPCAMNLWTAAWAARNDSSITTTACSRGDSPVMRGIPPRSPARPASRPA